jgi:hypothetical protein
LAEAAAIVSELVETRSVSVVLGVDGFTTSSSSTVSWSCAATVAKIEHVIVVPDGLHDPTCWPPAASVTMPDAAPRPVPDGSVTVIWLPAGPERPPVEEVPNRTV